MQSFTCGLPSYVVKILQIYALAGLLLDRLHQEIYSNAASFWTMWMLSLRTKGGPKGTPSTGEQARGMSLDDNKKPKVRSSTPN
ncbi:hypothetical protein [Absidia glauca]|uniref:Uncharacterized protein n=1 Tax=Absidia glauca TaxID=4829 RepID=A0A168RFY1_ABSGL|nr:hypothetical protein [Absidia glauca]